MGVLVFLTLVVGCLPIMEAQPWICPKCPKDSIECRMREEIAHRFFKNLADSNFTGAYKLLSKKYQDSLSYESFREKIINSNFLIHGSLQICYSSWAIVPDGCVSEEFIPPCAHKYYGFYIKYREGSGKKDGKKLKMILLEMQKGQNKEINNIRIEPYHR